MKKSDINPMPEYFERYIKTVDDVELPQAFDLSIRQLEILDKSLLASIADKKYAADKWTIKEIFQHIIDWERILAQRTLLYARCEGSTSQSIDENLLAENMNAERRDFDSLIDELIITRLSTKAMFESFDDRAMLKTGMSWKYEISVLAMGFTIVGHQKHHVQIVEDKYYPLINL
ncbi:MAG: DinB family protein [Acidobacteriota bacterium]